MYHMLTVCYGARALIYFVFVSYMEIYGMLSSLSNCMCIKHSMQLVDVILVVGWDMKNISNNKG